MSITKHVWVWQIGEAFLINQNSQNATLYFKTQPLTAAKYRVSSLIRIRAPLGYRGTSLIKQRPTPLNSLNPQFKTLVVGMQ